MKFAEEQLFVAAGTSKSKKDRVIPLRPELSQILRDWKSVSDSEPNGEVLPWPHDSLRPLYDDWHAIQDAAGFPADRHYVPHNCRSSCATELGRAGVDAAVVQKIMGHRQISTTLKYYFDADQMVKEAVSKRSVREIPKS